MAPVAPAEVRRRVLGPLVRLREQHAVVVALVHAPADLLDELIGFREVLAGRSFPFE